MGRTPQGAIREREGREREVEVEPARVGLHPGVRKGEGDKREKYPPPCGSGGKRTPASASTSRWSKEEADGASPPEAKKLPRP